MGRRKNPNIKKSHTEVEFDAEKQRELLKCSQDIVYFCENYVRVKHPVKGSVPFALHDYQKEMMRLFQEERFSIVLASRQVGKSICSAIFLLWYAMFNDTKEVLIASNKNSGAMEMISRIQYAYEHLPHWLKPGITDDGWNMHRISFDNESSIESTATSEDAGRGMSVSLLFLDEFAFVSPGIQQKFWTAMLPTLSTGGSCIVTSTPNGDADLFAQMWRTAVSGLEVENDHDDDVGNFGFKPLHVPWDAPPGRDEKFKQEQIAVLGERKFRQEYECEFISSEALLIDSMALQMLEQRITNPKNELNGVKFWEEIQEGEMYLIGADPSTGSGRDFTVIEMYHFPTLRQVAEYRTNTMSSPETYKVLKGLIKLAEKNGCTCYFSVENNGVGEGIIALYLNDENPPMFAEMVSEDPTTSKTNRLGMNTNGKSKFRSCTMLKDLVEKKKMDVLSRALLTELKMFIRTNTNYEAQPGGTDDCISAVLIILRILENIAMYEDDAFEKIYTVDEYSFESAFGDDEDDDGMSEDEALPFLV